jgi:hypothetical protein
MKFFKLLFALAVLIFAVWGAFWLFGIVAVLFKWLLILGVLALAGVGAYKLLAKPDAPQRYELSSAELEMQKAERMLAEIRQKQLTK